MKNCIGKKNLFWPVLLISMMLANYSWAVSFSFDPGTTIKSVGVNTSIDLVVSGLEQTDAAGFDMTVNFDPTIVSFTDYSFGNQLGDIDLGEAEDWSSGIDNGSGAIHLCEISWLWDLDFQADSFVLATLTFEGITEGKTELLLSDIIVSDSWGGAIDTGYTAGEIIIGEPVPEPASIVLFGVGLFLTSCFSRRIKKRA